MCGRVACSLLLHMEPMIQETIEKLEARIAEAESLSPEKREELKGLLASLRSEVVDLAESEGDKARSIAGFAEVSTHEATRPDTNQDLLELAVKGLFHECGRI